MPTQQYDLENLEEIWETNFWIFLAPDLTSVLLHSKK